MKHFLALVLVIFFSLTLIGCCSQRTPMPPNTNRTIETWQRYVSTNPNYWTRGADRWFFTGDPTMTERANRCADYTTAMSTMGVNVPNFTNLRISGDFQVQIFGTYENNTVYMLGPNEVVRQIAVAVRNNTLCLTQMKKCPGTMGKVIIRIGMKQLHQLIQTAGCGKIEIIRIRSNGMDITTKKGSAGQLYLSGNVNLRTVNHLGNGSINILGANTPSLSITNCGCGNINIAGNVGVRSINNRGKGIINIIGANSTGLNIAAQSCGRVAVSGHVNLNDVRVKDAAAVFVCGVDSTRLYAFLCDCAKLGVSGRAGDVYVNVRGGSSFKGRFLCAANASVRARDAAHINISSSNKIFAAATQNGTVYFFGTPNILSQFVSGNGVVMPIYGPGAPNCCPPCPTPCVAQAASPCLLGAG